MNTQNNKMDISMEDYDEMLNRCEVLLDLAKVYRHNLEILLDAHPELRKEIYAI